MNKMSLFPYNRSKHVPFGDKPQGTPIKYVRLVTMMEEVYMWHLMEKTSDFSNSAESVEEDLSHMALGLLTMLAEPSHLRMLEAVGIETAKRFQTLEALERRDPEAFRWFRELMYEVMGDE